MPQHQHEVTSINLDDQGVSTFTNTTGEFSNIIEIEVPSGYRYEFPTGHSVEAFVYNHEVTTASSGATDEEQTLSNNLVDSPAMRSVPAAGSESEIVGPHDLVVWDDEEGSQVDVDAVDYTANTFDYSDSGAAESDLQVWYLWGDSAQVEFRNYSATEESYDKELIRSMRHFHSANTLNRNGYITFQSPFTLMEKEKLAVSIKTDVDLTNWDVRSESAISPGSHTGVHGYSDVHIPCKKIPMKA